MIILHHLKTVYLHFNLNKGVKPISEKQTDKAETTENKRAKIVIGDTNSFSDYSEPNLIKLKNSDTKTAKVSLNDCLACSGCVTTAETLLIEAQSIDEFIKNSLLPDQISIVCISPQSLLSIANYFKIDESIALKKVCFILNKLNVKHIFNYDTFVHYVLEKAYLEFKQKVLEEKQQYLVCSECPGWVCYAEKKLGDWIIPFLSNIKSPQQVIGHVLKSIFKNYYKKNIYISCIMPCFDKKLEASREGHRVSDGEEMLEVDTVISTVEFPELLEKLKIDFNSINLDSDFNQFDLLTDFNDLEKFINENSNSSSSKKSFMENNFLVPLNFTSNGYGEYIIRRYIHDYNISNFMIERTTLKNSDFKILNLKSDDKLILSFSLVYGFRNIQNILRNKNKIKYNYMEVMACPGGCINGGGQMRSNNEKISSRDILKQIEENIVSKLNNLADKDKPLEAQEQYYIFEKLLLKIENLINKNFITTKFQAVKETQGLNLKW